MKKPALVIFDLDDTLLINDADVDKCWRKAFDELAEGLEGLSFERFLATFREHAGWYWSDPERHRTGRLNLETTRCEIACEALKMLGIDDVELGYKLGNSYNRERERCEALFPEALEVLDSLRNSGIQLAMATNGRSDLQRRKINKFNLAPYFELIVIEGEFGIGKPDQRVYRHILNTTRTDAKDSWMVGDNLEWDVFSPMRLGITGIWFNHKNRQLPTDSELQPDKIIRCLRELI